MLHEKLPSARLQAVEALPPLRETALGMHFIQQRLSNRNQNVNYGDFSFLASEP